MEMPEENRTPGHLTLYRYAAATVVLAGVAAAIFTFRHTLSCFMLAFVLAYIFDPIVMKLEKAGVRRIYGICILYTFLGIFSFFFLTYFIPFLTLRWQGLLRDLPLYIQKMKELVLSLKVRVEPVYAVEEWNWLVAKITEWLDELFAKVGAGVYSTASLLMFNILNLLLAPILVFFMLYYKKEIIRQVSGWLPLAHREAIVGIGQDIDRSMGGFIRGQIIVSAIVAILSAAALLLLGIDYPVLCGIFAGIASILPFVGVILATLPPLFLAYVKFQSVTMLLNVTGAFAVIYFLEGYLVKPLVFQESMDLNPLVTILVVMALGEAMGFWGILLAIPIAAAIRICGQHIRRGDFSP